MLFINHHISGNKETVPHSSLYDISQTLANHAVCGIPAAFHNSVPTVSSTWPYMVIEAQALNNELRFYFDKHREVLNRAILKRHIILCF